MSTLHRPSSPRRWLLAGITIILLVLVAGALAFDRLRSPMALYREAETAPDWRAAMLYDRLSQELPEIEEYFRLAEARRHMPSVEAVSELQAIIGQRPHSPAAYEAHLILARTYAASGEADAAEEQYRAALALEESPALRVELARDLAEVGDTDGAYSEFKLLLADQPDTFASMRRYGSDPLAVAADLNAAQYFSDALETLGEIDSADSALLRAEALAGLGESEEAAIQYETWLAQHPDDADAQLGLASTLAALGRTDEALDIYRAVDTPEARLAEADLLVDSDPEAALDIYRESEDPIAWWTAAGMLEAQGREREALDLYARVAGSGSYLSDDAAYRMLVLAQRENNTEAEQAATDLLAAQGLTYLGLQASGEELTLSYTLPYNSSLTDTLAAKVAALEQVGLDDFALRELQMAAAFERRAEVVAAAAQALAERGQSVEVYRVATGMLARNSRRPLAIWRLAYPKPYANLVTAAAEEANVDPLLVWAVMRQESEFDPEALSLANAQGLMQVTPATRDSIAEQLGEEIASDGMFDPEANIRYGTTYLGSLIHGFDGDIELAVMAYNGGPGSVLTWLEDPQFDDRDDRYRWIGFGETREYLMRVMLNYAIYQKLEQLENQSG